MVNIRRKYRDDPNSDTVSIGKEYGVTHACIYKVVHNYTWVDPDYTPPEVKAIKVHRVKLPPRKIATDYSFQCHICGMGCDTVDEANSCCESRREWNDKDGYTGNGLSKWDETNGRDPHYKYIVHHDWANRGNW